jgi:hypothetical protein
MGQREKAYGRELAEPEWVMPADAWGSPAEGEAMAIPGLRDVPPPDCSGCSDKQTNLDQLHEVIREKERQITVLRQEIGRSRELVAQFDKIIAEHFAPWVTSATSAEDGSEVRAIVLDGPVQRIKLRIHPEADGSP